MKIAIILGTRPEIIKMAPIIQYCEENKVDHIMIHSGQHYSHNMDKMFFEELELPEPKYMLGTGSKPDYEQTGEILIKIGQILEKEKPDIVLVQGDTNTVLAGAIAASKQGIKVGHVEAALRSYDRNMPEEINRIVADHLSDYLFCPTKKQENIAFDEAIPKEKVFVTGNTIVDAVLGYSDIAENKSEILKTLGLEKQGYILATVHRKENVDVRERFDNILKSLALAGNELKKRVIYSIHPRAKKMIENLGLKLPENIELIEPVGYLDSLNLQKNAALVMTDSGGLQEEACILKVPCVTLRDNTERPETVDVGANIIAGVMPNKVLDASSMMLSKDRTWKNPFGDGTAAQQIMSIIFRNL